MDLAAGTGPSPEQAGVRRLRLALYATGILLGLVTLVLVFAPAIAFAIEAPSLDLVLHAIATSAAAAIATLAWFRFREVGQAQALFFAAAFVSLCLANLLALVIVVLGLSEHFGFSVQAPGQAPLYLWTAQRAAAAALLVAGGIVGLRGVPAMAFSARTARAIALAPGIALLGLAAVALAVRDQLPQLLSPAAISSLATRRQALEQMDLSPALLALNLPIGLAFLVAMVLYARLYARSGRVALGFFAIAFLIAAFGQLHFALIPGAYTTLVTSSDIFRVGFYAVLLLGLAHGAREDLRSLRRANERLERLRDADAARAVSEERARLAREIHDGLAQDLWLAQLKHRLVLESPKLPGTLRPLAVEASEAIARATGEARQALITLSPASEDRGDFAAVAERNVHALAEQLGLVVDFEGPSQSPTMTAAVEGEILRVLREALTNVRKHADATRVRVVVQCPPGLLVVSVSDNGVGFNPARTRPGHGLRTMRERAQALGAVLEIESQPMDGARVRLQVPIGPVTAPDGQAAGAPHAARPQAAGSPPA